MILAQAERGMGRHRIAQGCVAATDETSQPALDGPPLYEDVAAAGSAAQADVGAETIDQPLAPAARVGSPEQQDVAEEELERRSI
jgi:hypothetical protein